MEVVLRVSVERSEGLNRPRDDVEAALVDEVTSLQLDVEDSVYEVVDADILPSTKPQPRDAGLAGALLELDRAYELEDADGQRPMPMNLRFAIEHVIGAAASVIRREKQREVT